MPEFAFSVSGTEKALEFRLTPIAAVMMGAISDLAYTRSGTSCSRKFRPFCGSIFLRPRRLSGRLSSWSPESQSARQSRGAPGRGDNFGLRIVAVRQHWHLPTANLH
jgi:hypothetical protein